MGSHSYVEVNPTAKPAFEALMLHPNFNLANPPIVEIGNKTDLSAIVHYVVDSVAHFVSPPKQDDEHDELSCDDVANEIRTTLKAKILKKLKAPETVSKGESLGWTKITDSIRSRPPMKTRILLAYTKGRNEYVQEGYWDGSTFCLTRYGELYESSGYRFIAWAYPPKFPKELV